MYYVGCTIERLYNQYHYIIIRRVLECTILSGILECINITHGYVFVITNNSVMIASSETELTKLIELIVSFRPIIGHNNI